MASSCGPNDDTVARDRDAGAEPAEGEERDRVAGRRPLRRRARARAVTLVVGLARAEQAGEVALHVGREHGHAQGRELLGHELQRLRRVQLKAHARRGAGRGPPRRRSAARRVPFPRLAGSARKTAKETYYVRTDGKGKPGETTAIGTRQARRPRRTRMRKPAVERDEHRDRRQALHGRLPRPSGESQAARYSERDYGRFGSYFVADVTKEKPLEVKYRLWVQDGEMTVEQCKALHESSST